MNRDMQKNIYATDSGGWVVEYREFGDRMWTRVYVGGDGAKARAIYRKL